AFIKLAATLQSTRVLPLGGLGLLLGIDRFMATGSAVTNVIGNAVAVLAIARWDGAFDREKFRRLLAARTLNAASSAPDLSAHAQSSSSGADAIRHVR